eukprot:GHVS01034681.1.p1 GENE.GHVS01034681.1~~GHVS01034681.1.p1  ORF type:complete len:145 (+),score=4.83 GHVS01034681.1:129-563(+)
MVIVESPQPLSIDITENTDTIEIRVQLDSKRVDELFGPRSKRGSVMTLPVDVSDQRIWLMELPRTTRGLSEARRITVESENLSGRVDVVTNVRKIKIDSGYVKRYEHIKYKLEVKGDLNPYKAVWSDGEKEYEWDYVIMWEPYN